MSSNIFSLTRPSYSLPETLSASIEAFLQKEKATAQHIADCVLRMSDFYIDQPLAPTPWQERWCQIAQVAYFLPLNYLRAQAVWDECQKQIKKNNFEFSRKGLIDFGSGLGAASLPILLAQVLDPQVLQSQNTSDEIKTDLSFSSFASKDITFVERSGIANQMFLNILQATLTEKNLNLERNFHTPEKIHSITDDKTILCSFSLTEHEHLPDWLLQAHSVILIEPATREDGRNLLKTREQLIEQGFHIAAPCTHQQACPLLNKSEHDWCHDRIHIKMPNWFKQIEKLLPMKNENLTFSYLLALKNKLAEQDQNQNWRITGDTQIEKGKSRQLICRGPEREFISWMHRKFPKDAVIPRGLEIEYPEIENVKLENKGQELRITEL